MAIAGCERSEADPRPDSTQAMAEELQELSESLDPQTNEFANSARVVRFRDELERAASAGPGDLRDTAFLKGRLADELLFVGQTREAIALYEELLEEITAEPRRFGPGLDIRVIEALGLASLRLGEEENCLRNPSSASCILPLQGDGIHELEEGSRQAIRYYSQVLEHRPDDLVSRWLLNVAYMTLGEHPEGVPEPWLIELPREEAETGIRPFFEIAPALGLDVVGLAGGSVVDDFTGNGYLDVFASSWGLRDQLRFFENMGDGRFIERTLEAGLQGITGGLNIVHADYNNDGHLDLLVLRGAWLGVDGHHPNSLLRNNGDGTFTDVTIDAGLGSRNPTQTAAWADFNGNGLLDLFIGNESEPGRDVPSELYRNNGDGTFTEISREVGLSVTAFVKGTAWGDYTNNGRPDLYLSVQRGSNLLFRNDGPGENGTWRFTEVGEEAGVQDPFHSFPTWFFDYNNSGHLDLFVSGYQMDPRDLAREYLGEPILGELPRLYRNEGDGTFTDVTAEVGLEKLLLTMGSNFGDLDNDGFLDFYAGTGDPNLRALMPNRMFRNAGGERFQEVTMTGRFGNIQKGHGVSFADLNHNGQQDIHVAMGGFLKGDTYQNLFFENPGTEHGWIQLQLRGATSDHYGVGARIMVEVREDAGGFRQIHRTVGSGSSFGGNPFRVHIGLGSAESVERLVVHWPTSGITQEFTGVEGGRILEVEEGSDALRALNLPSFIYPLDQADVVGHHDHPEHSP